MEQILDTVPQYGKTLSLSQTPNGSTAILIVDDAVPKFSVKKNWKFMLIAVGLLMCNTLTGAADQQLSKEANSPTFAAPFFYLWFMSLMRSVTFLVYLPIRLLYDAVNGRQLHYQLDRSTSQTISYSMKNVLASVKAIFRYVLLVTLFGVEGKKH